MKEVKDWEDLIGLENDRYKIDVDDRECFWIVDKNKPNDCGLYLSTHFFYRTSTHYIGFLEKYFNDVKVIR